MRKKLEILLHAFLDCIIMDVAKELSHMFEYQVFALGNKTQIDILAECAVELMSDTFDRSALLRKILKDSNLKKRELETSKGVKWYAPGLFRKLGVRKMVIRTNDANFIYLVKKDNSCKPTKYG